MPQNPPQRRDLRTILIEGGCFSFMVGIGETYLPVFVLALGLGEVASGLIAAVPVLIGGSLQLATPILVRRIGSLRRATALCTAIQAASFVPLLVAAIHGRIPQVALFLFASLYWAGGLGAGPAWNTWMNGLVAPEIRARFFARRSYICQFSVLLGIILGGLILDRGSERGFPVSIFAVIFAGAALARFSSTALLLTQPDSPAPVDRHRDVPVRDLLRRFQHGPDGRLLLYLVLVQTALFTGGPYLTPFLKSRLGYPYDLYMGLIAVVFVAKMLAFPLCGRFAHRFGARRLLWIGGIGLIPTPALWTLFDDFWWLLFVQLLGGAAIAAYELAQMLLFFETIHEEERTSMLTMFNLANSGAMVAGTYLGKMILVGFGETYRAYLVVFVVSSMARFCTIPFLWRVADVRFEVVPLFLRILGVRAGVGSIDSPEVAGLPSVRPAATRIQKGE